jgi:hypothetical protein
MIGSPQSFMSTLLSRMFDSVRSFLLSRGGVIFAGILLVVLMVWFLGPLVGLKSVSARLWFLVILALLALIALLVKYWGDHRLMRVVNGLRNFLVSRGGIILIGLLLIGLLIWFAGPLIGLKSVSARIWVLAILASLLLIIWLVKWSIDRRRGKKLEQDIEESAFLGTRPDRESEIALLRKQMHDAIGALKSSELVSTRRGSAALYALPWYMVIGPSAVGKSSILRNSNLNFPYSKHDPRGIQGVGGTRNCDWWFSDQAIFLDTAGRYTTEEDDHEEWFAFLEMLRTNRSKQPINGVIVAVNIADLLTSDSAAILENAKVVRDRIDELVIKLGIVFPVYLIFTKSDLIKGFASYFDDLSEKEREQVWGASMLALEQTHCMPVYARIECSKCRCKEILILRPRSWICPISSGLQVRDWLNLSIRFSRKVPIRKPRFSEVSSLPVPHRKVRRYNCWTVPKCRHLARYPMLYLKVVKGDRNPISSIVC